MIVLYILKIVFRVTLENIFKILNNSVYFQNIVVCNEPFIIKSWLSAYCLISASKNCSTKGLRFHLCTGTSIDYFLQLLKHTGYQECYVFFKLIDTPIKSKKATENRINNKTTKSFPLWTQRSSR